MRIRTPITVGLQDSICMSFYSQRRNMGLVPVSPCSPYTPCIKNLIWQKFRRLFVHPVKKHVHLLIRFYLMFFEMGNSHQNTSILNHKPTHSHESIHNHNAPFYRDFAMHNG